MHELASALMAAGHTVRIVSTASGSHRGTIAGVPVRYLQRRRFRRGRFGPQADEVAFALQVLPRIAASRVDVWHAMGTADAAAAAALGKVRAVRSVYTDLGFPNRESRARRPDRAIHDFVVRSVHEYVCMSAAAGQFLRDGYGREPRVIAGGVDTRVFVPAPARATAPVLLFASDAGEARKNLGLLLDALAVVLERRPAVRLWVAGPGDQQAALRHVPTAVRDAVDLLGAVAPERMAELYGRAWVTVLPAQAEAFGLVLVESLACGTPVVALDEGGPREIVRPGVGALAAPEPADLARACEEALDLAARRTTVADCRDVARLWDWRTAIVPRLEEVYSG